ncbi:histidine phosphatase family protein [[Pseudomonas] boreopolis]|uniref:histidine phosphatase family protein n=1 Tax=Xanthomonas boreopolis TaxID=86183 RepID=UPI003D468935
MTRLLLIRHAQTDANGHSLAGRLPGVGLNDLGRRQARALAARLGQLSIAAIYASPLERAMQTAEAIATLRGHRIVPCEELLEIDYGEWTGLSLQALADDEAFRIFNGQRSCAAARAGEYMLQAQARMVVGLDRLRRLHPQQTIAVVSHGDMIRGAVAHYAGIPLDLFHRIEISPASLSVVDVDDMWIRIVCINDTGSAGDFA